VEEEDEFEPVHDDLFALRLMEEDEQRKRKERIDCDKAEADARAGQVGFRKLLISRDRCCVLTGEAVTEVLEAAHIVPVQDRHTLPGANLVADCMVQANGLLEVLRINLHRLFDAHLLQFRDPVLVDGQCGVILRLHGKLLRREQPYARCLTQGGKMQLPAECLPYLVHRLTLIKKKPQPDRPEELLLPPQQQSED